jgi:REP element-mobilizing transposase RayT
MGQSKRFCNHQAFFVVSIGMRKRRQLRPGAIYHVVARANRQEMIFEPDAFKQIFLAAIIRAKKKYRFSLFNFCIMGNHIHFIIQPGEKADLSKIMQWILSVFAKKRWKLRCAIQPNQ